MELQTYIRLFVDQAPKKRDNNWTSTTNSRAIYKDILGQSFLWFIWLLARWLFGQDFQFPFIFRAHFVLNGTESWLLFSVARRFNNSKFSLSSHHWCEISLYFISVSHFSRVSYIKTISDSATVSWKHVLTKSSVPPPNRGIQYEEEEEEVVSFKQKLLKQLEHSNFSHKFLIPIGWEGNYVANLRIVF